MYTYFKNTAAKSKITYENVFFGALVFGSGLALFSTLRKSEVFARILEWM